MRYKQINRLFQCEISKKGEIYMLSGKMKKFAGLLVLMVGVVGTGYLVANAEDIEDVNAQMTSKTKGSNEESIFSSIVESSEEFVASISEGSSEDTKQDSTEVAESAEKATEVEKTESGETVAAVQTESSTEVSEATLPVTNQAAETPAAPVQNQSTQVNAQAQAEAAAQAQAEANARAAAQAQADANARAAAQAQAEANARAAAQAQAEADARAAAQAAAEAEAARNRKAPYSIYVNGTKVSGSLSGNVYSGVSSSAFTAGTVEVTDGAGNPYTLHTGEVGYARNGVDVNYGDNVEATLNGSYGIVFTQAQSNGTVMYVQVW